MALIFAMCSFALSMSISPGPVNLVTLSSGIRYGVIKTMPFVAGAAIGFTALLFVLGLGIGQLVQNYPEAMQYMGIAGSVYILYMAYKIISSRVDIDTASVNSPGFFDGALLQWLNPKAWIACLSGLTAFTSQDDRSTLLLFSSIYLIICFFSVAIWAIMGAQARRFIHSEQQMRLFNIVTGSLLGLVAMYLFIIQYRQ